MATSPEIYAEREPLGTGDVEKPTVFNTAWWKGDPIPRQEGHKPWLVVCPENFTSGPPGAEFANWADAIEYAQTGRIEP